MWILCEFEKNSGVKPQHLMTSPLVSSFLLILNIPNVNGIVFVYFGNEFRKLIYERVYVIRWRSVNDQNIKITSVTCYNNNIKILQCCANRCWYSPLPFARYRWWSRSMLEIKFFQVDIKAQSLQESQVKVIVSMAMELVSSRLSCQFCEKANGRSLRSSGELVL